MISLDSKLVGYLSLDHFQRKTTGEAYGDEFDVGWVFFPLANKHIKPRKKGMCLCLVVCFDMKTAWGQEKETLETQTRRKDSSSWFGFLWFAVGGLSVDFQL